MRRMFKTISVLIDASICVRFKIDRQRRFHLRAFDRDKRDNSTDKVFLGVDRNGSLFLPNRDFLDKELSENESFSFLPSCFELRIHPHSIIIWKPFHLSFPYRPTQGKPSYSLTRCYTTFPLDQNLIENYKCSVKSMFTPSAFILLDSCNRFM